MITSLKSAALMVCAIGVTISAADAGVRGGRFVGNFSNSEGETANLVVDFRFNGTARWTRNFGTGAVTMDVVSFSERDFALISFWEAGFLQEETVIHGFSLLGLVNFVSLESQEFVITGSATTFRTGNSQRLGDDLSPTGNSVDD